MNKEQQLFSIVDMGDGTTSIKMNGSPADISIAIATIIHQSEMFRAILNASIELASEELINGVDVIKKEEGFYKNIKTQGDA